MRFWDRQDAARTRTRRLLLAFALAVVLLLVAVHAALVLAWLLLRMALGFDLPFPAGFLATNVGVSLMLVLGGWWIETSNLSAGGVELARRVGAREARPGISHADQRLCNVVDELCIAAQMSRPQAMVLPRVTAINAFAAGWDESDAVVAVSQGALDWLTREQLQGMVAHELSHLHEGDTRLNMQLAGMVFGLELIFNFGDTVRERGGLAWWFGSAIMVAGSAGWLAGRLLKAAVSRQREYLADARAVQWTRSRDGLGGTLRKVMAQQQTLAGQRTTATAGNAALAHHAVQHMLLVELPGWDGRWRHYLDSHPSLQERVRAIYGRAMGPLPLVAASEAPEPGVAAAPGPRRAPAATAAAPLAARWDPTQLPD
ncbi:hypothetical protein GCM10022279_26710 [Comamonas faecalis]|uniref:Peptidase M48 domain-containing protein n=1 Tax=Comamonas faecalis TaxID=1387849 RepID=A0ABP7RSE4_9BURK